MMESKHHKLQNIDELLAYLPKLYSKDFVPIIEWNGTNKGRRQCLDIALTKDITTWFRSSMLLRQKSVGMITNIIPKESLKCWSMRM
jgi:hypothetical protein